MSEFSSVLELAQAVTAESNRIGRGAKAEQEASRVLQRVDAAAAALANLNRAVTAARALAAASSENAVSLSGLAEGREAFAQIVERTGSRPSDQAFTAARNKIDGVTKRVNEELTAAWTHWTSQSIGELPLVRMPMLPDGDRKPAQQHQKDLRDYARKQVPAPGDILMFKNALEELGELLKQARDPEGDLVPLLERLAVRAIPLSELTDEQIGLLRQVADQIEVRRRGA